MQRLFFTFALVIALVGGLALPAFAQEQKDEQQKIPVLIDGLPVVFDVQPVIENGRTLVPFRAIAEALNVAVNWDGDTQTVSATDGETSVRLQIGNKTSYHNDVPITLDVPPVIQNGRTLIPLRFFSEAYNCEVVWDGPNNTVRITSPPKEMVVTGFYALGDSKTSSWTNLFGKPYPETSSGNTDVVGELVLGWYSLDKDGNLLTRSRTGWQRPDGWEKVLETATEYKLKTEMVVHITDGDGTISSLLKDETAMTRAVNGIMEEAVLYQGINLDFEGLGYRDEGEQLMAVQDYFSNFVRFLAEKVQAVGLDLTLTLHAPNSAYRGYDYKSLGEVADRIIIMAYDYGTRPEPDSLVIQAVEQSLKVVPKEKLILGISIPSENPESILTKVGIAKRYQLNGIALWRLGLLTDEMWDALRKTVEVKRGED
jgi:hypothetical protein